MSLGKTICKRWIGNTDVHTRRNDITALLVSAHCSPKRRQIEGSKSAALQISDSSVFFSNKSIQMAISADDRIIEVSPTIAEQSLTNRSLDGRRLTIILSKHMALSLVFLFASFWQMRISPKMLSDADVNSSSSPKEDSNVSIQRNRILRALT
jgi:hypothetical protein